MLSTYPWLLPTVVCSWLGLWIGQSWFLYRGVRAFEHERGPLIAKHFYSPNVVGKEGMIGRRGRVAKDVQSHRKDQDTWRVVER